MVGGRERAALRHILRLAEGDVLEEAFIPQRETMRRRNGVWESTMEIMFPGYVFVATDHPELLLDQLRRMPMFARLLGDGQRFLPLSPEEVNFIKAFCGEKHVAEMSVGVIEGDKVHVLLGPLRNCEGIIRKINRHKRAAYVEMQMLGRSILVKLGLEIVHKYA